MLENLQIYIYIYHWQSPTQIMFATIFSWMYWYASIIRQSQKRCFTQKIVPAKYRSMFHYMFEPILLRDTSRHISPTMLLSHMYKFLKGYGYKIMRSHHGDIITICSKWLTLSQSGRNSQTHLQNIKNYMRSTRDVHDIKKNPASCSSHIQ